MAKNKIGTWNGVPVYTDFLPIGTRRTGQRLNSGNPKFAVFHDTGNPNTTAQQNVNYYKNTYMQPWDSVASAHIFVDDTECIICIPVTEKAWHVIYSTPTDNAWYGADANDVAFGIEVSYYSDRNKSLKSLDNACRIMAALCNSWDINPRNQMPGHQDIQADKQDPGNLLAACGYNRRDMTVIDNLVVKYMNGDAPVKKVAPAPKKVVKQSPPVKKPASKGSKRIKAWSKTPHYKGTIQYNASLRQRSGSDFSNYTFNKEIGTLKKGDTVYIFEEIQDAEGNIWCRTYSPSNNGWVHKHTIK
ncbi:N-acetylmuramoyl-L-alanine amidase [Macrococcoides caseolyticum]|uniref:N-acetylmuramoyl-L-alanine amidase n=1 Tax=Macrococcoides caseolyticum TaxID=69966 RepID=UPI000C326B1A|nr:N-acetylmuramoyl-L-alanine amidase [Macrococcus caseolyticus]PKE25171.1 N-acetylmuramoyl-L-alanine amidase [Macrococcus caseolyticus]